MRHYSTLTEEEISSLAMVYPTTTNVTLCAQYDISRAGLRKLAIRHGWSKDRATMAMMKAQSDNITPSQVSWLRSNFADMPNTEIMFYLGIGEHALARLRHRYGLKKSHEYLKQMGCKAREAQRALPEQCDMCEQFASHSRGAKRTGTIYQEIQRNVKGREQRGCGSAGYVVRGVGFVKQQRIRWVGEITANYKRYRFRSTDYQSVVSLLSMMRNRLAE